MKVSVKKEIFLIIIESLFHDSSKEIETGNCIPFYHFLLNTLEREIFEIPIELDSDISLCNSINELLSGFDLIDEDFSFWNSKNIAEYLKDFGGLSDEEYQISISKFRRMYDSIKCDFLMDYK